jgi:hypothetical protein
MEVLFIIGAIIAAIWWLAPFFVAVFNIGNIMLFIAGAIGFLTAWFIFWPALAIIVLLGGYAAEEECYGWSFICSVLVLGLMYIGLPAFAGLLGSPIKIFMVLAGYVGIGLTWSTFKWYMKLKSTLTAFKVVRDEYLRNNKLPQGFFSTPVSDESDLDVKRYHKDFAYKVFNKFPIGSSVSNAKEARDAVKPKIWDNKAKVVAWGVYWPTSALWFLFNDFIREIIETIYNMVSGRLQAMADRMFSGAL